MEYSAVDLVFSDRRLLLSILYHLNRRDFYCFLSVLPKWTAKRVGSKLLEIEEYTKMKKYPWKETIELLKMVNSGWREKFVHYKTKKEEEEHQYRENKDYLLYSEKRVNSDELKNLISYVLIRSDRCRALRYKIKGYLV